MGYERWTDRARRSLVLAQECARALNHAEIGTGHLLAGLMAEGGGVAYRALSALGVGKIPEALARHEPPGRPGPAGHIPLTSGAKRACELALREAIRLNCSYVGTEHLLLGILAFDDQATAQVILTDLGTTSDAVRATVLELLGGCGRLEGLESRSSELVKETDALRLAQSLQATIAVLDLHIETRANELAAPFTDRLAGDIPGWKRSSFHEQGTQGGCVVVHRYGDGVIGVQDARRTGASPAKLFSPEAWAAFVAGVKAGEFDFGEGGTDD